MIHRVPGVPAFRRLPVNEVGRDLIVSDIHGCFGLLAELLIKANFDESKDRLIIAGDLVDRGPQSEKALDWLCRPYVHVIRGNHDEMVIIAAENNGYSLHEKNGGEWFVKVMRDDPELADDFRSHFSGLPLALEIPCKDGRTFGVVHAECPTFDWNRFTSLLQNSNDVEFNQVAKAAIEMRTRIYSRDDDPVTGIDLVFVGHTPVSQPMKYGNTIYIDTGAVFSDGRLTLMQMDTQETWTMTRKQHRASMWERKFKGDAEHQLQR